MIFAIRNTEENQDTIQKWNSGDYPNPEWVDGTCIIITWSDPHLQNIIRSEEDFLADFAWVKDERKNEWAEVIEL